MSFNRKKNLRVVQEDSQNKPLQGDDLEILCAQLITAVGEDKDREGLLGTPRRWAESVRMLTSGYLQSIDEIVNNAIFTEAGSELVLVRNIEFYSLCEHHLLPFFGKLHLAYIPAGKVIGLSKIPRIVNMYARRFQIQERLTEEVAGAIDRLINPRGIACFVEAQHMCVHMRGIQGAQSAMITQCMKGEFQTNEARRLEFLTLVRESRV
jgi:GTP cyclohydrolase IA